MKFKININREDFLKLHELELATGIDKGSIVPILIDEVYSSYKCAQMSGDSEYMLMQLTTEELKRNIKRKNKSKSRK